jgi:nucleoredoxin
MRIVFVAMLLLQTLIFQAAGKLAPLTVKDISLMLRSGYSLGETEKETRARYFADTIDPAAEKALLEAGATPAFLAKLKNGAYAVPAAEIAALEEAAAARSLRQAQQAEQAKQLNTLYQHQQEQARAAAKLAPSLPNTPHVLARELRGSLVTSKNGLLSTYADQPLEKKKLIALYFSAKWCGPCRKFTPELVSYYQRVVASHPDFEIVFVSADRSGPAMESYMRDFQMPWPAISFDKLAAHPSIQQYAGNGIPSLVLIDAQGKVVSDSYDGEKYLGPNKVLADLDRIFSNSSAAGPVAKR